MDHGERPFPCKLDGCRLSFTTEDHLNVHRKKHDMLLNLELPNKSNLFADQTPTPTRLIGKCEEVGLFEDLQKVNPFDETFRRAVEEKSSGSGEIANGKAVPSLGPVGTGDETLHTPHVFPLLERRDSQKLSKLIISRSNSKRGEDAAIQSEPVLESRQSSKRKKQNQIYSGNKKPLVKVLPKSTPATQPVIIISCEQNEALPCIKPSTPLHPVKAKLKKYLARNGQLESTDEATQQPSTSATASTLSTEQSIKPVESNEKPARLREESTDQKHERWKMAAKRYRTRVKQNQDKIHQKNLELEEENLRLKTELARMRHVLSLHKDCSVTRALAAGTKDIHAGAAGPSTQAVLVPMVAQNSQHLFVEPVAVAPSANPVVNAARNSGNPVYIILGKINSVPESVKPI